MIARLWYGSTRAEDADAYVDYVERTGVAAHRATPGNRGSLVLRRARGDRADFLVLSLWDSEQAIAEFAGEEIDRAVYFPEDERYLIERRDEIDHYEIVAGEGPGGGDSP
ncbi:MAG: antibiotic biosynthesis monooxygenase [Thermoanaerobaculia bacterium]